MTMKKLLVRVDVSGSISFPTTYVTTVSGESFTSHFAEIADKGWWLSDRVSLCISTRKFVRSNGVTDCTKTATEFHALSLFCFCDR